MLDEVFEWEVEEKEKKLNPDGARKYIDRLDEAHRVKLFGVDGAKIYANGGDWQKLLRGWDGFQEPKTRLH